MTSELRDRLRREIHRLTSSRLGPFTSSAIVHEIMEDTILWNGIRDELAADKLASIVNGTMRGPLHQANSAQLGLPGFEDIPKFIRAGRKWVAITDANAAEL